MAVWYYRAPPGNMNDSLSTEMQNAVRDAARNLGEQLLGQAMVVQDYKDKSETKLLAWTDFRVLVLQAKPNHKVELSVHLMNLQSIESHSKNQLSVLVSERDGRQCTWRVDDSEAGQLEKLLLHLCTGIKRAFPHVPLNSKDSKWSLVKNMSIKPLSRMEEIQTTAQELELLVQKPCGNFSVAYACMCSLLEYPVREEIIWDVDTVMYAQDCRTLKIRDFDHLESRDAVPLVAALESNKWFEGLDISAIKVNERTTNALLDVLACNTQLTSLTLCNIGLKSDYIEKLSNEIRNNDGLQLQSLDLSENPLEDKGVSHLCEALRQLAEHLCSLRLRGCGMSSKGAARVAEALRGRSSATLRHLCLAKNNLRDEKYITALYDYLGTPNNLQHLDLSETDLQLEMLSDPLREGCSEYLEELNLSRTTWTSKKGREATLSKWSKLFYKVNKLRRINLSYCKLPTDALKRMLEGLANNSSSQKFFLNIAGNELREIGARVLESCIPGLPCLEELDISDNGFDKNLERLVDWIADSKSLKKLCIDKNFEGVRQKHVSGILSSAVRLVQEEKNKCIESLSVGDCHLRADTCSLINALGTNSTLVSLNLSGNAMGDLGARLLSRALQINRTLQELKIDRNGITAAGFEDIVAALKNNYTLRKLPLPSHDAAEALRSQPKRTVKVLQQLQQCMERNQSPRLQSYAAPMRMQHSMLLASSAQMIEHLSGQVQRLARPGQNAADFNVETPVTDLLKESTKSAQLLPLLREQTAASDALRTAVSAALSQVKVQLQARIQESAEELITFVQKEYPTITKFKSFEETLKKDIYKKREELSFPSSEVTDLLASAVENAYGEVYCQMASLAADRVMDSFMEALAATKSTERSSKAPVQKFSEQLAATEKGSEKQTDDTEVKPISSQKSSIEPKPEDSPTTAKRQSWKLRRVRPISVLADILPPMETVIEQGEESLQNTPKLDVHVPSSDEESPVSDEEVASEKPEVNDRVGESTKDEEKQRTPSISSHDTSLSPNQDVSPFSPKQNASPVPPKQDASIFSKQDAFVFSKQDSSVSPEKDPSSPSSFVKSQSPTSASVSESSNILISSAKSTTTASDSSAKKEFTSADNTELHSPVSKDPVVRSPTLSAQTNPPISDTEANKPKSPASLNGKADVTTPSVQEKKEHANDKQITASTVKGAAIAADVVDAPKRTQLMDTALEKGFSENKNKTSASLKEVTRREHVTVKPRCTTEFNINTEQPLPSLTKQRTKRPTNQRPPTNVHVLLRSTESQSSLLPVIDEPEKTIESLKVEPSPSPSPGVKAKKGFFAKMFDKKGATPAPPPAVKAKPSLLKEKPAVKAAKLPVKEPKPVCKDTKPIEDNDRSSLGDPQPSVPPAAEPTSSEVIKRKLPGAVAMGPMVGAGIVDARKSLRPVGDGAAKPALMPPAGARNSLKPAGQRPPIISKKPSPGLDSLTEEKRNSNVSLASQDEKLEKQQDLDAETKKKDENEESPASKDKYVVEV